MIARAVMFAALLVACSREHPAARVDLPPTPQPPAASASAAPAAFFPEDPSLDAVALANPAFVQETWTGATDWQQHCREWGINPSREDEVRDAVNAELGSRGIHLPDKVRAKGTVVALGSYAPGVVPRGSLHKLVVCTEGVATRAAHAAFTASLMSDRDAPHGTTYADLGEPDVAWVRAHATGEVEYGFRWPHLDAAVATRVIDAVAAAHDGRFDAKLRGSNLWWTGLRAR